MGAEEWGKYVVAIGEILAQRVRCHVEVGSDQRFVVGLH